MKTLHKTIQLHRVQHQFRHSDALYRSFVGGRGAGKSWIGAYDLIRRAQRDRTYLVASPTGVIMGDTTFPRFKKIAQQLGVLADIKLTPYPNVTIRTQCKTALVRFRTAEDPDRMRGPDLAGAWLDEASLMDREAYDICIGSLREEGEQGWLSASFTPKGPLHWTHETFNTGKPDTAIFRAHTRDNPFNPPGFAATLARQYGDSLWARQELEGEFISLEDTVFPAEWFRNIYAPEWPHGITHSVLYLDPSQGKDSKHSDAQAYVRAGFFPGREHQNLIYLECVRTKEPPPEMVARGVRMVRERKVDLWGYETNGTLGLLSSEIERQLGTAKALVRLWPVNNVNPKRWRIRNTLMPYLAQGRVRVLESPGGKALVSELLTEPLSEHDDCADAAAGAVALLEGLMNGG